MWHLSSSLRGFVCVLDSRRRDSATSHTQRARVQHTGNYTIMGRRRGCGVNRKVGRRNSGCFVCVCGVRKCREW